jgi:hypothetical protein
MGVLKFSSDVAVEGALFRPNRFTQLKDQFTRDPKLREFIYDPKPHGLEDIHF